MKKLLSIMLGMTMILGTVAVSFADTDTTKTTKKGKKKKPSTTPKS